MDKQELLQKSSKAAYYTVIFKIGSQLASLLITILLVRFLSEHDYGVYNLLYSTIGIIGIVASFGLTDALQRYIPEYYQKSEFILAHRLYKFSSFIRLSVNILIIIIIFVFWESFAGYLKIQEYRDYFLVFSFIILVYSQWRLLDICLGGYFLQKYTQGFFFALMLFKGFCYFIAQLVGFGLQTILLVDLTGYIALFTILQYIYAKKIPKYGTYNKFTVEEKKRVGRYAFYYNFNDMGVQFLDVNVDNFILAFFLNPVAVGAYAFSNRVSRMISRIVPTTYLIDVLRPLFFSSYSERKERSKYFYQFLIKIIYLVNVPILIFVIVFNKEIILLVFDGKYIEYSNILIFVLLFQTISAFQMPLGLVAQLHEKVEVILLSKVFGIYNLIGDIIFIKLWGILGVVFATGSAIFMKNLFIWWFVRDHASFRGLEKYFLKLTVYMIFMYLLLVLAKGVVSSLLIALIVGAILSILLLLLFVRWSIFTEQEKKWIYATGKIKLKII